MSSLNRSSDADLETRKNLVFIVEDDADVRAMLTQILELEGYPVAKAANGLEALQMLLASHSLPCVILLDLMMPVMNGWQFMAERALDPALSRIPVVVLSGDVSAASLSRAKEKGANSVLRKPIQLDALLDLIKTYCPPENGLAPV